MCEPLKTQYVKSLLDTCDVPFIQKHWLGDEQIQSLASVSSSFLSCDVCGFDPHDVLRGRPYSGPTTVGPFLA